MKTISVNILALMSIFQITVIQGMTTRNDVHASVEGKTPESNLTLTVEDNLYSNDNLVDRGELNRNSTLVDGKELNNITYNPSLEEAKSLYKLLLKGYVKYVKPINRQTDPLHVFISLSVFAIQEFDEVLEKISFAGVFFLNWKDESMVWEKNKHAGIEHVFVGYKDVWIPEIILANPSEKLDSYGQEWQMIRFNSEGWATWAPGVLIKAKCSLDVRYFPFDVQECGLYLFTWGYLSNEVQLIPVNDSLDMSLLDEHSSWKVINTSFDAGNEAFVSRVTYTFRLARKPQYVIINVVLPILFLCLLNVLVFILPAESGERVSFAITVLLSIAVFMTIVSNTLPKSSEPLPLIGYVLVTDLFISALISICTVINLCLFHRSEKVPIPNWLIKFHRFVHHKFRRNRTNDRNDHGESENISSAMGAESNKRAFNKEHDVKLSLIQSRHDLELIDSIGSPQSSPKTSWQDISLMFDHIFCLFFTIFVFASFAAFFLIVNTH